MKGLELIVREYRHWHLTVSVLGNALFVAGSVLFFKAFEQWYTLAVWTFVVGSSLMLLGALGEVAKASYERRERLRARER